MAEMEVIPQEEMANPQGMKVFAVERPGLPEDLVSFLLLFVVYLTLLTDPLRIQPWSQDRRNQTKSNRESEISRESRQKKTGKKVASKGHRRDKIENTNKNTQTVETN